jgi:hypothetical protein
MRCNTGGMRTVRMRCFGKDFQPYLFAPAGWIEALAVRIKGRFKSDPQCGEVVLLCTQHVSLRFRAIADLPPMDAPLLGEMDILEFAEAHPPFWYRGEFHSRMTQPDGTIVACRYWDCDIDRAEGFLRAKYARPYTMGQILRWYEQERDPRTRASLLVVLAASRDPRAGLVLAGAIRSTNVDVRIAAAEALNRHFGADLCSSGGNLESEFAHAEEWLEENEVRLRKAARDLPRD